MDVKVCAIGTDALKRKRDREKAQKIHGMKREWQGDGGPQTIGEFNLTIRKSGEKLWKRPLRLTPSSLTNNGIDTGHSDCAIDHIWIRIASFRFFFCKIDNKMIDLMEIAIFHSANPALAISLLWRTIFAHILRFTHSFLSFKLFCRVVKHSLVCVCVREYVRFFFLWNNIESQARWHFYCFCQCPKQTNRS